MESFTISRVLREFCSINSVLQHAQFISYTLSLYLSLFSARLYNDIKRFEFPFEEFILFRERCRTGGMIL